MSGPSTGNDPGSGIPIQKAGPTIVMYAGACVIILMVAFSIHGWLPKMLQHAHDSHPAISSQSNGSQSANAQSQVVTVVTAPQSATATSAPATPVNMAADASPPPEGLTDHVYPPVTDTANPEADVNWSTPTRGHLGYSFFQVMPDTPSPFFPSTQWRVECTSMFTPKPVWKLMVDSTTCGEDSDAAFRSQSTSDQPVTVKEGFNHV